MMSDDAFFCSQLSSQSNEKVFATASRVNVWFLLENADLWEAQILASPGLPPDVKSFLSKHLNSIPLSRVLFIKNDARLKKGFTFYVVLSKELNPVLYKFKFNDYQELVNLDLNAVVNEDANYAEFISKEPVFLVCTHGKHDQCCAKFGLPIYQELIKHTDEAVWQCSHVGGDRFAANVLCFPHGIYYGHVEKSEASNVVDGYAIENIYLEKYRGRSCYGAVVQAAEYYLRQQTGNNSLADFRLVQSKRISTVDLKSWVVLFSSTQPNITHAVGVAEGISNFKNYLNCKATEEKNTPLYYLVKHEILEQAAL